MPSWSGCLARWKDTGGHFKFVEVAVPGSERPDSLTGFLCQGGNALGHPESLAVQFYWCIVDDDGPWTYQPDLGPTGGNDDMVGHGKFDPLDLHCVGVNEHASCAILLKKTAGRALLLGHVGKLDDVGFGGIWFDRLQRIPHTGFLTDRDKDQTAREGAVKDSWALDLLAVGGATIDGLDFAGLGKGDLLVGSANPLEAEGRVRYRALNAVVLDAEGG